MSFLQGPRRVGRGVSEWPTIRPMPQLAFPRIPPRRLMTAPFLPGLKLSPPGRMSSRIILPIEGRPALVFTCEKIGQIYEPLPKRGDVVVVGSLLGGRIDHAAVQDQHPVKRRGGTSDLEVNPKTETQS